MYLYNALQIFLYNSITSVLMMLLYSYLVQKKYYKILFVSFAIVIGISEIYFGDLVQLLMLLVFGIYRFCLRKKWDSFETLAFIFVLCWDMLLADLSTFAIHFVFTKMSWVSMTLTIVINVSLYLVTFGAFSVTHAKINAFKNRNLMDKRLLKVVIDFSLIIFLGLQFVQFTAEVLDIAVVFQWLVILFIIFFIIATIVVMFYFIRSYQLVLKKQAEKQTYQNLLDYTDKLEDNYAQLRKFKHDYQNVLLSLDGYIQQSQQADLKAYYRQIVLQTGKEIKTDNMRFDGLEALKVPALQSLTYQKLVTARKYNITTFLEVRDSITAVPVDMVKLVRILGILLDNAIEATYRQDHGVIRIAYIKYSQAEIEVIIQNTIAEDQPLALNELFDAGYTSKGNGHGMGLTTVKQMVDAIPNMTLEVKVVAGQYRVMIDLVRM